MAVFRRLQSVLPYPHIPEIEKEYNEIIKAYYLEDETKTGIHSGRFCELVSSLLCEIEFSSGEDLNKIKFEDNINKLENCPNKSSRQEITCLIIPRTLKSIYTIRNKKRIAHFKLSLPRRVDQKYIKQTVDWVISQLIVLYLDINDEETTSFLQYVSYEENPKVETFENGEMLFYDEKLTWGDKIIICLYNEYNTGRIQRKAIVQKIKPRKGYLSIYLRNLKDKKLIHENNEGIILTQLGIQRAIEILGLS